MTLLAVLDETESIDVATNHGWNDFCKRVRRMDGFTELRYLCDEGWSEDLVALRSDLAAIAKGELSKNQRLILEDLETFLREHKKSEVLVISDGISGEQ
jgi:hypothetical protein